MIKRKNRATKILLTIVVILVVQSSNLVAQNGLSFTGGLGIARLGASEFEEIFKVNGFLSEVGVLYHIKKFGVGLNVPIYNYSKIENPNQLELTYNEDLSVIGYGNEFFQQNTNLTYYMPTLYIKYDISIYKKLKFRFSIGAAKIKGNESLVRLSAPGNYQPTKVGYKKHQVNTVRLNSYGALMYDITPSSRLGLKANYEKHLANWGFLLSFESKLKK